MHTIRHFVVLWLFALVAIGVQAQEMTVAERNAAQGFNDTIDRLAPDFDNRGSRKSIVIQRVWTCRNKTKMSDI